MRHILLLLLALCSARAVVAGDDRNIYDLDAVWTNAAGESVSWASLSGKPRVVAMFFSSCGGACPRLTSDLLRIDGELTDSERAGIGYVMASFDTENDSPAALTAFARTWKLSPDRWTLLGGGEDAVEILAAVLGVRFRKEPEGGFSHGNVITVVDAAGRIVHQKDGLGGDVTGVVEAIRRAVGSALP